MHTLIPGTQAVTRALQIMKLFLANEAELELAQLAKRSGLNRTTVYRLVRVLELEGMLRRDLSSGAYRLGPEIAALGRRAEGGTRDLADVARRDLEVLAELLEETITLEVFSEGRSLVVAEAMGRHILSQVPCVGQSWEAHATATGKVLLASIDGAARRRLLKGRLPAITEHTISRQKDLEEELSRVARRGHALNLEELELGYVAVAVPVRDGSGGVIAALGVGGAKGRLTQLHLKGWIPQLNDAATKIADRWRGERQ